MHAPFGQKTLPQFAIHTVQEMGWAGLRNGELLDLAESQFDIFVSTDKNLPHQQNLSGKRLAVIILPSNKVPVVAQLIPALEQSFEKVQPGTLLEIPHP